jgi:hypothetical protein
MGDPELDFSVPGFMFEKNTGFYKNSPFALFTAAH